MSTTNGNGHSSRAVKDIEQLFDKYAAIAAALKTTLDLLRAGVVETRQSRTKSVIDQALALRGETAAPRGAVFAKAKAARLRSAALLARFSRTVPRQPADDEARTLATLARTGYVKKTKAGYLRTVKPYAELRPNWTPRKASKSRAKLAQFDVTTPRPLPGGLGFGPLIHGGYLARKGDGYIRTAKPYVK